MGDLVRPHSASLGLHWPHLAPPGLVWPHLASRARVFNLLTYFTESFNSLFSFYILFRRPYDRKTWPRLASNCAACCLLRVSVTWWPSCLHTFQGQLCLVPICERLCHPPTRGSDEGEGRTQTGILASSAPAHNVCTTSLPRGAAEGPGLLLPTIWPSTLEWTYAWLVVMARL